MNKSYEKALSNRENLYFGVITLGLCLVYWWFSNEPLEVLARSTRDAELIYEIGAAPIQLGDRCEKGSQLRPHIVWFGEEIMNAELAVQHIGAADRVLVVGTSLVVWPAAGFIRYARKDAKKVIVDLDVANRPDGFEVIEGSADVAVPNLVEKWLGEVR